MPGLEGHNRGEGRDMIFNAVFCSQSKSFIDISFLKFWNKYYCCKSKNRICKQWNWTELLNVNSEYLVDSQAIFLFQVEERTCDWLQGHTADMWMKKCTKYAKPSNSVSGILWHVAVPMTCPGHFQLSWACLIAMSLLLHW